MRQGVRQSQRTKLSTSARVDPRVVLASQVLQLAQAELEQAIDTELSENPALERLQEDAEPVSEEAILRAVAPQELKPSSEDFEFRRSLPRGEDASDWLDLAASTPTLLEHLHAQLLPRLPQRLRKVGLYMVECVNEKGYLNTELEEIALSTNSSLEEVEEALKALQACEPAGVGARNLKECLYLQLRNADTFERQLARKIVRNCMEDFIGRRALPIARKYKVMPAVVEAAFEEILALSPFPGEAFCAATSRGAAKSLGITPDVALRRTESGWEIEVRGSDPQSLRVSRSYERRLAQVNSMKSPPRDERRHLVAHVQRATDFIRSLEQRRTTLRRIGQYLIENQAGFVATGEYQFLRPLTRSRMAKDLGLHESTVSRATMDKFVQIANGEVVPFDVFFKPALRVQKMIEEILGTENPASPLSDEAIARMLAKKGVKVARRTVNKYRDRTKLLSSRKRRSA